MLLKNCHDITSTTAQTVVPVRPGIRMIHKISVNYLIISDLGTIDAILRDGRLAPLRRDRTRRDQQGERDRRGGQRGEREELGRQGHHSRSQDDSMKKNC